MASIVAPIKLIDFCDKVKSMTKDSNFNFQKEFERLNDESKSLPAGDNSLIGRLEINKPKNRFVDIMPFDENRVPLQNSDNATGSDYINASFIKGYNCDREYIAAQGPLGEKEAKAAELAGIENVRRKEATVDQFWQMVWENQVPIIVTLTRCVEGSRIKCAQFWPNTPSEVLQFHCFRVTMSTEKASKMFVERFLEIQKGDEKRNVLQFAFLHWPDFDAPKEAEDVLKFVETVRAAVLELRRQHPLLVHCSAGVGRTGTFIAVDCLLQHIRQHDSVDVFECVHRLRQQRIRMVQTEAQYVLVYNCLQLAIQRDQQQQHHVTDDVNQDELPAAFEPAAVHREADGESLSTINQTAPLFTQESNCSNLQNSLQRSNSEESETYYF